MSNTDSITIKLSNNDFFYVSAKDMPSDVSCNDKYLKEDYGNCSISDIMNPRPDWDPPPQSTISESTISEFTAKNEDYGDVLDECKYYKILWSYSSSNEGGSGYIKGIQYEKGNYAKLVNDLDKKGGDHAKWAGGLVLYNKNNNILGRIYWLNKTDNNTYLQLSCWGDSSVYLSSKNAGSSTNEYVFLKNFPTDISGASDIFEKEYNNINGDHPNYLKYGHKIDIDNSLYTTDFKFKLTILESGDLVLIYKSKTKNEDSNKDLVLRSMLLAKGYSYLKDFDDEKTYKDNLEKIKTLNSENSGKIKTLNDNVDVWIKDNTLEVFSKPKPNGINCYKKELCKNKEKANEINNLQNNHLGTDQNYLNSKVIYSVELRRGISLSIGILILFGTIIYSKGK